METGSYRQDNCSGKRRNDGDMFLPKLQTLVYDILPPLKEGARKRCSECGSCQDNCYGKRCDDGDGHGSCQLLWKEVGWWRRPWFLSTALERGGVMETAMVPVNCSGKRWGDGDGHGSCQLFWKEVG